MPTATETALVTKDELAELADWERKYADAKKRETAAEKEVKFRRQSLAEKVLGVKSADELKQLSPEKIEKLFTRRLGAGLWKRERGAPAFAFQKTKEGRYLSWKDLYVGEMGETAALEVEANTALTYSYRVEVSEP